MATAPVPVFPLRTVSTEQLQNLGKAMWNWKICGACNGHMMCSQRKCPWSRMALLHTFWRRYRTLTINYAPESTTFLFPALSSHDDLLRLIQAIRNGPDLDREHIVDSHFSAPNSNGKVCANAADQDRAMNLAASIIFMINCGTSLDSADFFEQDGPPISWRSNVTATAFASEVFPHESPGSLASILGDTKLSDLLRSLAAS